MGQRPGHKIYRYHFFLLLIISVSLVMAVSLRPALAQTDLSALLAKLETLADRDKPPVLLEIASALSRKSPREALDSALEALRLAQSQHQIWNVIKARMIAGNCYCQLKQYERAREHLDLNQRELKTLLLSPAAYFFKDKLSDTLFQNSQLAAECYQSAGRYEQALPYYLQALEYQKKSAAPASLARLLYMTGLTYFHLADYAKAMTYVLDSLKEAEKIKAAKQIALSSCLAGRIHLNQRRYPEALDYFHKALDKAVQEDEKSIVSMSLNEIGNVLTRQKKFSQAISYRDRALEAARQANDPTALSNILHDFGSMYLQMDRPEDALVMLQKSYALDKTGARAREIAANVISLANAYFEKKDYRRSLKLLSDYLPTIREAKLHQEMLSIHLKLADLYQALGSAEMSNAYLRQAYALRDSMRDEEIAKLTQEIRARYEMDKKQKENDLLKRDLRINALDIQQKSLQIVFLLALSALVLLFVLILYNRYRFRLKAHQELEFANRQIQEDQVQLTKANRRLDELTREDPLTGLANRRELLERFEQEKVRFLRSGRAFSLIMADLDNFKIFNDTYGHNCGDDILKTLASLLRSMIRRQDIVGRWGGDEFLIVLPETGLRGGEAVARKIRLRVRRTAFPWKEKNLRVQLSLGVSVYKKGMEFDDCLKYADQAMFRIKRKRKAAQRPA
jgi:diguanylate cyclase (GGDEF)-like protein